MTVQYILNTGKFLHCFLHQEIGILHRGKPTAVKITSKFPVTDGSAMSHMILRHHHDAMAAEKVGQLVIALRILTDTVNDLNDSLHSPLGHPAAPMDQSRTPEKESKNRSAWVSPPHRSRLR